MIICILSLAGVALGVYISSLLRYHCKTLKYDSQARMDGKTVLITGASSGIGKATAEHLLSRGARVILACRNLTKTKTAVDEILSSTGVDRKMVNTVHLDLSDLDSVRKCAKEEDFLRCSSSSRQPSISRDIGSAPEEIVTAADGDAASVVAVETHLGMAVMHAVTPFEGTFCQRYCFFRFDSSRHSSVSRDHGSTPEEIMSAADDNAASAMTVEAHMGMAVVTYTVTSFEGALC
ncbi:uncharacterized protein LOC128251279 [Octopus bimaculoides]|nr:uncharacterized protein LOC128251279 [Octopus bimaculoides]